MARNVDTGLSPRVRGNLNQKAFAAVLVGSIPARAGEPRFLLGRPPSLRVYPRACGGTPRRMSIAVPEWGLSPRVRGNLFGWHPGERGDGSIPARAGEPEEEREEQREEWVYPRACGGTLSIVMILRRAWGLSPRVRGNRARPHQQRLGTGSIPARAGEPMTSISARWNPRVYPRACGGTDIITTTAVNTEGLSPRVRGNLKA